MTVPQLDLFGAGAPSIQAQQKEATYAPPRMNESAGPLATEAGETEKADRASAEVSPPPRRRVEGESWTVFVATREGESEVAPVVAHAESKWDAVRDVAARLGVPEERCLALRTRAPVDMSLADDPKAPWCDRLVSKMEAQIARADRDIADLRSLHAEILGCSVDELDARIEVDKAREKAERDAARAARGQVPPPSRRGKTPSRIEPAPTVAPVPESAADVELPMARLTERQRELLACMRVEGQLAVYTREERIADWDALKTVMVALGGRWKTGGKKKPGGFLFPDDIDAAEVVRLALATGEILDPRAAGFFPTPAALADRVVALAGIRRGDLVLEPSAGRGALADAVMRAESSAHVTCFELLPDNARALREKGFETIEGDFLRVPSFAPRFDVCVMNPPFGERSDIRHVLHVLGTERNGGVGAFLRDRFALVAIMSAGVVYREDSLARRFREVVTALDGLFEENPEGSFLESGTGVRTVTLVIPRCA